MIPARLYPFVALTLAALGAQPSAAALGNPNYFGTIDGIGAVYAPGTYVSGNETLSMGGSPSAFVSAIVSGAGDQDVHGQMDYSFSIGGVETFLIVPVALDYATSLTTSKGTSGDVGASTAVTLDGYDGSSTYTLVSGDGSVSKTQRGTLTENVIAGRGYSIILSASVGTRGPDASFASAYVDPYLYIDPAFLRDHPGLTLEVSPTIVNAVSAVPEPASWATATLGFAIAGAAVRRRRKPPAATLA